MPKGAVDRRPHRLPPRGRRRRRGHDDRRVLRGVARRPGAPPHAPSCDDDSRRRAPRAHRRRPRRGRRRVRADRPRRPGRRHAQPTAPAPSRRRPGSALPAMGLVRAATAAHLDEVADRLRAPPRAPPGEAGFDAVEVHLGHNYLLSSFLSPNLNQPHRRVRRQRREPRRASRARVVRRGPRGGRPGARRHRQVQHGRRRPPGAVARREPAVRPAARGRRPPRRPGAHRRQLAAQRHVLLPRRRAACASSCGSQSPVVGLGLRVVGRRIFPELPVRGGVLPALRPPVPRRAGHAARPARRHQPARHHRAARWPGGLRVRRHGPGAAARARPAATGSQAEQASEGLCIHCNKCLPTIYSGTRCVVRSAVPSGAA